MRVVVLGGGVIGITSAYYLARAGFPRLCLTLGSTWGSAQSGKVVVSASCAVIDTLGWLAVAVAMGGDDVAQL